MSTLAIIDGSQTLHRILHVDFYSKEDAEEISGGFDVRGMAGFVQSIRPFLTSQKPDRVVVVWDGGTWSSRRMRLFPDYKRNRIPKEDDTDAKRHHELFREQRAFLEVFLEQLCIPTVRLDGREADDIIAYIALDQTAHGKVTVVSEDNDFRQLVPKGIEVYRPASKEFWTRGGILPKDGIPHEQYLLWKCFFGDPSDNVPGVKGVGEKTLTKAFDGFRGTTFGELYDHLAPRRGEGALLDRMLDGFGTAMFNYRLLALGLEEFTEDETQQVDYVLNSLCGNMVFHKNRVRAVLEKYGLKRPLSHFETWAEPFERLSSVQARSHV